MNSVPQCQRCGHFLGGYILAGQGCPVHGRELAASLGYAGFREAGAVFGRFLLSLEEGQATLTRRATHPATGDSEEVSEGIGTPAPPAGSREPSPSPDRSRLWFTAAAFAV